MPDRADTPIPQPRWGQWRQGCALRRRGLQLDAFYFPVLGCQYPVADLTVAVVEEAAAFRLPHGDPARHYKLTFVTPDQRIIDSGSVDILAGR